MKTEITTNTENTLDAICQQFEKLSKSTFFWKRTGFQRTFIVEMQLIFTPKKGTSVKECIEKTYGAIVPDIDDLFTNTFFKKVFTNVYATATAEALLQNPDLNIPTIEFLNKSGLENTRKFDVSYLATL